MSLPTIYHPTGLETGARMNLSGKEAWHALGVRRMNEGDTIRVMDGQGSIALATVEQINGPRDATLIIGVTEHIPPLVPGIILAAAIAKGDRQSTLLDMATQLGISAYQPLDCERSVTKMGKHSKERWQRICLEACKQSGAAWLPDIFEPMAPAKIASASIEQGRTTFFSHPEGEAAGRESSTVSAQANLTVLIGPEGGFTKQEVTEMQSAGAIPISLGQHILRIETAAISLLARLRLE